MLERSIDGKEISYVLKTGKVIKSYDNDKPYPSKLILGFIESKPVHIVFALNEEDKEIIVITVYEPDPLKWDSKFERRL